MNWAIYCRYNQARSIIAAALLRQLYPECTIKSGGIEASHGAAIPASVSAIANAWSLTKFDRTSAEVDSDWMRDMNPEILVADELIRDRILEIIPNKKIRALAEFADHNALIPIDPTGLAIDDLALELSKVIILAVRWALELRNSTHRLTSHLILDEAGTNLKFASSRINSIDIAIDTNITRPVPQPWYGDREVTYFNPRNLNSALVNEVAERRNIVLVSRFEIDECEKFYLSHAWHEFLLRLCVSRSVALISEQNQISQVPLAATYLALAHSTATSLWQGSSL